MLANINEKDMELIEYCIYNTVFTLRQELALSQSYSEQAYLERQIEKVLKLAHDMGV